MFSYIKEKKKPQSTPPKPLYLIKRREFQNVESKNQHKKADKSIHGFLLIKIHNRLRSANFQPRLPVFRALSVSDSGAVSEGALFDAEEKSLRV